MALDRTNGISIDHTRSALTEAITALEVAVHEFARRNMTLGTVLATRIATESLEAQVKHIGFSGTIN